MDAVEAAVAENDQHVAALDQRAQPGDDFVHARFVKGRFAGSCDIGDDLFGLEPLALGDLFELGDLGEDNAVGLLERGGELVLENGARDEEPPENTRVRLIGFISCSGISRRKLDAML